MAEDSPGFRPPQWAKPAPPGYGAAADAAHFVAAPLLAAGAIALLGVVAADADKFRTPSVALLMLTLAAVSLIASVQIGFHARALLYSAADVAAWWGEDDLAQRQDRLRRRQREDLELWRGKIFRAVMTYNVGVTLLATGVAFCLAPPATSETGSAVVRWIACGIAGLAALCELGYSVARLRLPIRR